MTLFEMFLEKFGGWSVTESCSIANLPFLSDFKRFFDSWDKSNERLDLWIPVSERIPKGAPIVYMYCTENKEFSVSHFTLSRSEVKVTHWQPLVEPDY